jgi:hypothetical protein
MRTQASRPPRQQEAGAAALVGDQRDGDGGGVASVEVERTAGMGAEVIGDPRPQVVAVEMQLRHAPTIARGRSRREG